VVRINDRGTFVQTPQEPKCLDLTDGAFSRLGGSLDPDAGHIVVTQQVLNQERSPMRFAKTPQGDGDRALHGS
jgi:rare lipoprotein A (peptidoglycan hydrolase)